MALKITAINLIVVLASLILRINGQVFVNQDIAEVLITAPVVAKNENLVTQTVYGFLDFTTTIGNTIMVFSPHSASVAVTEKSKDVSSNIIIDTKPGLLKEKESIINIKPSKPQSVDKKTETSSVQKVMVSYSSIVQVNPVSEAKLSSKVEIKSSSPIQANLIQNKSPIIISKIQVIEEAKPSIIQQNIISKVAVVTEAAPKSIVASRVEIITEEKPTRSVVNSVVQVKSDEEPAAIIGNNIAEPEYDFLSRQPSEVIEETFKVINLRPSSKFQLKPRQTVEPKNKKVNNVRPTGLVSKMEGSVVNNGIMTSYETSVIGTYISGKYAQVLQSTSHVLFNQQPKENSQVRGKIVPTPSLRILKTAAPTLRNNKKQQHLEPTPPVSSSINEDMSIAAAEAAFNAQNSIKTTRKPGKRFKNRQKEVETVEQRAEKDTITTTIPTSNQPAYKKTTKNRSSPRNSKQNTSSSQRRSKSGRGNRKTNRKSKSSKSSTSPPNTHSNEPTTPSSSPTTGKRFSGGRRKANNRPSSSTTSSNNEEKNNAGFSRRFKPKVQPSNVEAAASSASTSLYKFKLNRTPGRWQYKTTPKPRVTIRKTNQTDDDDGVFTNETSPSLLNQSGSMTNSQNDNNVVTPQARSDDVDSLEGSESVASIIDDESATENRVDSPILPLETLKVEISTPPDFKDIYYEIATIKSPYTFQVGNVKNTRYITVTSTFEKSLESSSEATSVLSPSEPLTENILATTSNYAKDNNLDSSIATLPPIYLASDVATPPLETLTETFSTTQTMLKTHILPVIRSVNDTTSSTLVQTYLITRLVTATKTLPPMEAYHFNPSKTLNEFNSKLDEAGSELHLELEFGDDNNNNEQDEDGSSRNVLPADLDLANIGIDFKLPETDKAKIEQELKNRKKTQKRPTSMMMVNNNDPLFQLPQQQNLSPDQLHQLALLRLLNPAAAAHHQGQVITTSKPVLKIETIFETHILPVTQGHNTILSTISKIKGSYTKTDYEFGTSTIAPQAAFAPQIPQLPQINPLFQQPLQPHPQFTITSSPVLQNTIITQTNSKVLKLTFGARTALTTVFSTTIVPTVYTSYMLASVPVVAPTAAFPGYFPAPYPGYPYVG